MGIYAVKTNDADDAKILRAFGLKWQIGRDATPDEVSSHFAKQLADAVFERDVIDQSEAFKESNQRIAVTVGVDALAADAKIE